MEFGEILKNLRLREGLTQKELAEKLHVSKSVVGMWENGTRHPHHAAEEAIADYFNVSVGDLKSGDKDIIDLSITNEEREFIINYRSSSKESREIIKRILQYAEELKNEI